MEWHPEALELDMTAAPAAPAVTTIQPPPIAAAEASDELDALTAAIARTSEIPPAKAATLRAILRQMRMSIDGALRLLEDVLPAPLAPEDPFLPEPRMHFVPASAEALDSDDRVVEGVFDGHEMIGGDGKSYAVPPNYASKSKLVEGDMLKLTIGSRGNFIYKQIGPIERQRLIGTLAYDQETGQYLVVAGGRSWKILKASITYYKAEAGDEAVVLVPKSAPSKWAAVENIIRKQALVSSLS